MKGERNAQGSTDRSSVGDRSSVHSTSSERGEGQPEATHHAVLADAIDVVAKARLYYALEGGK